MVSLISVCKVYTEMTFNASFGAQIRRNDYLPSSMKVWLRKTNKLQLMHKRRNRYAPLEHCTATNARFIDDG